MSSANHFPFPGRRQFAEKLAHELERPFTLIDYGFIIIWLDRAGWYNHATIFESNKKNLRIVISRFSDFRREFVDHYCPNVGINCQPFEAMDLTNWVVDWSRSNEDGRDPPLGNLTNYKKLPNIEAETPSLRAISVQNDREGYAFLRKGWKA